MATNLIPLIFIFSILGFLYMTTFDTPTSLSGYSIYNRTTSLHEITQRDYSCIGEYSPKIQRPLYQWLLSIMTELIKVMPLQDAEVVLRDWYEESVKDDAGIIASTLDKAVTDAQSLSGWKVEPFHAINIYEVPGIISHNDYLDCAKLLDTVSELLQKKEVVTSG